MISIRVDGMITCDCDKCFYIIHLKDDNDNNIVDALGMNFHFFKQKGKVVHKCLCKKHSIEKDKISISREDIMKIVQNIRKFSSKNTEFKGAGISLNIRKIFGEKLRL
ncbi:hypothetical protein LCGC14_0224590 [marine sediment metagenome]|uniref:Uncharacterized protein n=1 Tax=marine sediment metagenome TaxID=412755 RepID=A0A0F9UCH1_9ZZZZ|nr:hypothetical protein [bacterium]